MLAQLVCPECRTPIVQSNSQWNCPKCGKKFVYQHGILSFLTDTEKFNEGEFEEKQKGAWSESAALRLKISRSKFLSLINTLRIKFSFYGRRDRIFMNEMAHGDKNRVILDLGCGGGRHYFCEYGKVVGVDPVLELLPMAQKMYEEVYHAGGYQLPFADNSFDYLVSSDVLGHIPFDKKDVLFSEMYRVLKPGGRTVHVIETNCNSIWYRQAKKSDLYQKYCVDAPGHIGLEYPGELRARFLKHGFKEVTFKKLYSNLLPVGDIASVFKHDFDKHPLWLRALVRVDNVLGKKMIVRELLHLFMEPFGMLDDALTPLDHGCGMCVVFEK
jgi:SAM-dependent methyltransferase